MTGAEVVQKLRGHPKSKWRQAGWEPHRYVTGDKDGMVIDEKDRRTEIIPWSIAWEKYKESDK